MMSKAATKSVLAYAVRDERGATVFREDGSGLFASRRDAEALLAEMAPVGAHRVVDVVLASEHDHTPAHGYAPVVTLEGREAIAYAAEHGLTLAKHADAVEDGREGLTVDEATEIADEDPSLIYILAAEEPAGVRVVTGVAS